MAKEFNLSPQTQFKQKIQKDESVRIELTLSKEQMEILNRAKELLSHALPGATFAEVITSLAQRYVKQRTGANGSVKKHKSPSPARSQIPQRKSKALRISLGNRFHPRSEKAF
ncbi:MAG: hypothetical protein IPK04_21500 [Bdellovibrionales bacterium]|nr:hypothetical protein [Bdellovibrionales bacterium]